MNCKKCDRCKEVYGVKPNEVQEIRLYDGSQDFDLCNKCVSALKSFLNITEINTNQLFSISDLRKGIEEAYNNTNKLCVDEIKKEEEIVIEHEEPKEEVVTKKVRKDWSAASKQKQAERMQARTDLAKKIWEKEGCEWNDAYKKACEQIKQERIQKYKSEYNVMEKIEGTTDDGKKWKTQKRYVCVVCLKNHVESKGEICRECETNFEKQKED